METKDINLEEYEISEQSGEEIILRKKQPKYPKWEELKTIKGYYIHGSTSSIEEYESYKPNCFDRNIFLTVKHAKSALAMAQISQLMPYYGGEITDEEWRDFNITKMVIMRKGNAVAKEISFSMHEFLAFHTEEQRDEFLKNNEQLVKDYLMIE